MTRTSIAIDRSVLPKARRLPDSREIGVRPPSPNPQPAASCVNADQPVGRGVGIAFLHTFYDRPYSHSIRIQSAAAMAAQLIGLGNYILEERGASIGRDLSNDFVIDHPTVSTRHCRIELKDGQYVIVDLASTNGTFVNDKWIHRSELHHGDRVRLGQMVFQFVHDGSSTVPELAELDEGDVIRSETIELDLGDTSFLPDHIDSRDLRRTTHDMGVLLQLGAEIASIQDSEQILHVLLERIFEVVPAEHGAIFFATEDGQGFLPSPVCRWRVPGNENFRASRTITVRVLRMGESILRNDLLGDPASTESIVVERVRSILCVPLNVMGNRLGVLYLDSTSDRAHFDQQHLRLVSAMANIGAVGHEHIRYVEWLESENNQYSREASFDHGMIGKSAAIRKVRDDLSSTAASDEHVLILGETGTGKELAARSIHRNSARSNGPFVVVNCGATTDTLLQSDLFGHVKGSFTGAVSERKGFFTEADGGTLFLDELGELSMESQAALLRIMEDGQVMRVGADRPTRADVRIVAASNREVERFRKDLFSRFIIKLKLPPLRERKEDIFPLVDFFVQKHRHRTKRKLGPVPLETKLVLQERRWDENIRGLENAIRRAIAFGKSSSILPEDLPPETTESAESPPRPGQMKGAVRNFESTMILDALKKTRGNVTSAAQILDMNPTYLQRLISHFALREALEEIRKVAF